MSHVLGRVVLVFLIAQQSDRLPGPLKLVDMVPGPSVFRGVLLRIVMSGLSNQVLLDPVKHPPILEIRQGERVVKLPIRAFLPEPPPTSGPPQNACGIIASVPAEVAPGPAILRVIDPSGELRDTSIRVLDTPLVPEFSRPILMSAQAGPPTEPPPQQLWLQRGREEQLHVTPIVDPDMPESGILVRFRQGNRVHDVEARIDAGGSSDFRVWTTERFSVKVAVPALLETGPAELEVRLRALGRIGGASKKQIVIVGSEAPQNPSPRIISLIPPRVGRNQSFQVSIESSASFGPDPSGIRIVLSRGSESHTLKPEFNSAMYGGRRGKPVVLMARPQPGLIGRFEVTVVNPGQPEPVNRSNTVALEILEEIVAPQLIRVNQASDEDLSMLRRMYEQVRAAGREFQEYNPRFRYLAIRARNLDTNPHNCSIQYEQGGVQYTLKYEDYSMSMGDLMIVRIPASIKPGSMRVVIANRSGDLLSQPVKAEVTIHP